MSIPKPLFNYCLTINSNKEKQGRNAFRLSIILNDSVLLFIFHQFLFFNFSLQKLHLPQN